MFIEFTIPNGQALSAGVYVGRTDFRGVVIDLPNAWTAADLGFQVSIDGTNWHKLTYVDSGSRKRVKITQLPTSGGDARVLPAEAWGLSAYPHIRIESLNTSDDTVAVNQGAVRVVQLGLLE